jgi:hypothetical protein
VAPVIAPLLGAEGRRGEGVARTFHIQERRRSRSRKAGPLNLVRSESRPEAGGDARIRRDSECRGVRGRLLIGRFIGRVLRATADRLGLGERVELGGDALGEGVGLGQERVVA